MRTCRRGTPRSGLTRIHAGRAFYASAGGLSSCDWFGTALMAGRMGSRSYMLSGWPQALHQVTRARPSKSTTSSQCGQR